MRLKFAGGVKGSGRDDLKRVISLIEESWAGATAVRVAAER